MFFLKSFYRLLETITDYALTELYDEQEIRKKLMELAVLFEMGQIDEDQFNQQEEKLLRQLKEAREYNRKQREAEGEEPQREESPEAEEDGEEEEAPGGQETKEYEDALEAEADREKENRTENRFHEM